jgi:predicted peptidase
MTGVRRLLAALVFLLVATAATRAAAPERGFLQRTLKGADGQEAKYAVFVPHNYKPGTPVPVILFLHGAGQAGTDGLRPTRVGLGRAIRAREESFPFLAVFPQAQKRVWTLYQTWFPGHAEGDRALAILAEVQTQFTTDPKRVYLAGLSMGGFGVWQMAAKYPDRWAALVPVCGGGDPATAAAVKHIPCWCFHGDADPVVPVSLSRTMVEALRKAGGEPRYDEFPGVGHRSWDKAFATDGLYEWLLQQKLK